jgi:hypothetical protein
MAKTVFILGAGASVEAGAPLMNNFLDTAQDLLNRGAFNAYSEDEKAVKEIFRLISELEAIHSRAPIDLNNIESLFGLIEMGNIIKKIGNISPRKLNFYRESLITMITRTLEESMVFGTDSFQFSAHESYAAFASFLKKYNEKGNSSSVLTFNYDLGLDFALQEKFKKVNYCLKKEDAQNDGFNLMKLHGSINWVVKDRNIEIVGGVKMNSENCIRISREIRYRYKKNLQPVIVPPTWNKNQYHGQLSNVWNGAANELNSADNIIIIGFSIPETDSFFKYLLGLGLMNGNRIRQIVVINKDDSAEIKARYNNLFGYGIYSRLQYVPLKFSEGINFLERHESVSHFNVSYADPSLDTIFL